VDIESLRQSMTDDGDVPVDKKHLAYLAMILLGMGMLWPYNTLISVPDFYNRFESFI
jgi:hypothetical protein